MSFLVVGSDMLVNFNETETGKGLVGGMLSVGS